MDTQIILNPETQKKANLAKIFGFIAIGLPVLYFAFIVIETLISVLSFIPLLNILVYIVALIIDPFMSIGKFLTVWISPIFGMVSLILGLKAKKFISSQENLDEKALSSAKTGILMSTIGTILSAIIWIVEIITVIIIILLVVGILVLYFVLLFAPLRMM